MIRKPILAAACTLFSFFMAAGIARSDEIVLKNGSRFTGKITGLAGDMVTMTSDYTDPIKIKKGAIASITTDEPVAVQMQSGETLKGKLKTPAEGRIAVEGEQGRGTTEVDWNSVAALNPPPVGQWHGSVNLAGNYQTGNTDRNALMLGADALRVGERDRFGLRFMYNIAEENDVLSARNIFGAMKYDYFFTKKFYGYIALDLLNDKFKDLNLRTVIGPGVGYQIWDDPIKSLSAEAGLSYFSEDYKLAKDKQWITARLAGNFRYKLTEGIVFTDQLVLYPSLENFSDFNLRNEAAIATALGAGWSLRLANVLDYDNNPPVNIKSTDSTFLVGLQYTY